MCVSACGWKHSRPSPLPPLTRVELSLVMLPERLKGQSTRPALSSRGCLGLRLPGPRLCLGLASAWVSPLPGPRLCLGLAITMFGLRLWKKSQALSCPPIVCGQYLPKTTASCVSAEWLQGLENRANGWDSHVCLVVALLGHFVTEAEKQMGSREVWG